MDAALAALATIRVDPEMIKASQSARFLFDRDRGGVSVLSRCWSSAPSLEKGIVASPPGRFV
jgi:hypothetical protein